MYGMVRWHGMVAWKMFDLSQVGNTISCKQALDFQLSFGNLAGFGKFTAKKHLAQKYVTLSATKRKVEAWAQKIRTKNCD